MFAYIPVGSLPCPARDDDDDDDGENDDNDDDDGHNNELTSPLPRVARQLNVSSALGYSERRKE